MIATDGDVGAIRIIFIRTHFTYYHGMAHFFPLMQWLCRGGRTSAYALAEMAQLVGIQCIPGGFVPRIAAKLAVFEKFTGGRIKNRERQETGPIFQSQCFTEKCKSINLRRLHVKSFAETCKGQWLLSWLGGFVSRDVVLDLFMIRPPRGEQRKWCLGTGMCAMGNWFANMEQCRWRGQRVAVGRWADQRHPWNWLSWSVSKVNPAWRCLPGRWGQLTDASGGTRRWLGYPGWSGSAQGGRSSRQKTPHFLEQCGCAPLEVPGTGERRDGDSGVSRDTMTQRYLKG